MPPPFRRLKERKRPLQSDDGFLQGNSLARALSPWFHSFASMQSALSGGKQAGRTTKRLRRIPANKGASKTRPVNPDQESRGKLGTIRRRGSLKKSIPAKPTQNQQATNRYCSLSMAEHRKTEANPTKPKKHPANESKRKNQNKSRQSPSKTRENATSTNPFPSLNHSSPKLSKINSLISFAPCCPTTFPSSNPTSDNS